MAKLVHPELSYQVRGVLLDVYNTLGPMLKEEYYRDAIVFGTEKRGVACESEKSFEVYYEDERVEENRLGISLANHSTPVRCPDPRGV